MFRRRRCRRANNCGYILKYIIKIPICNLTTSHCGQNRSLVPVKLIVSDRECYSMYKYVNKLRNAYTGYLRSIHIK